MCLAYFWVLSQGIIPWVTCPGNPMWQGHPSAVHPYVLVKGFSAPLQDTGHRCMWKESLRAS
eukprot:13953340-Ditylum_brightwellii.AAC.1